MGENGSKILVVEDEDALVRLLKVALEAHGYLVVSCSNGSDAISLCKDHSFAAVLMDIKTPVMDGLEATRQLRALPKTKELPILIVSALASPSDREAGIQAGADAYFTKPFHFKELLDTLDQIRVTEHACKSCHPI